MALKASLFRSMNRCKCMGGQARSEMAFYHYSLGVIEHDAANVSTLSHVPQGHNDSGIVVVANHPLASHPADIDQAIFLCYYRIGDSAQIFSTSRNSSQLWGI